MTDRAAELRALAAGLSAHDDVSDAFLAKSFTDQHLVVDLRDPGRVPPEVAAKLEAHDLRGPEEVYEGERGQSFAGTDGGSKRRHFVDVRTRGDQQSYVVDG